MSTVMFIQNLGQAFKVFSGPSTKKEGATSLFIHGKPVFRSGTFRDSMGDESTWDALHMEQMVQHFDMLKTTGVFDDVPIRKGHPNYGPFGANTNVMDELVGYVNSLSVEQRTNPIDGKEYSYLIADFEILDETAKEKVESGLWRNVSAEIGPTLTNDNAEYWPTFRGVAYVDTPAVQGLKMHAAKSNEFSLITEDNMTAKLTPPAPPAAPAAPAASAAPAAPDGAAPQFAAPVPQAPHVFTIAGVQTQDFAAVQAALNEIGDLREFRASVMESARVDFVTALVASNKLAVTQQESAVAWAKSLDDEQFSSWKKLYDDAPAVGLLAPHGAMNNNDQTYTQQQGPGEAGAVLDQNQFRIATLKGIMNNYVLSNTAHDKIRNTASYKELIALDPSFTL